MKPLETKRLILREWCDTDIPHFIEMNQDPEVMACFPAVLTPSETKKLVARIRQHFKKYGFGLFAVELKETAEFIGFVGLSHQDFPAPFTPCVEIGWRLARPFWGQGYATEAAALVLHMAFERYNLTEVVSFTTTENIRSQRIMEKLGMQHQPNADFDHPKVTDSKLKRHVLYRLNLKTLRKQDAIDIEPYDLTWPQQARAEALSLQEQLQDCPWFVDIEHIGSTAIFGMPAKPVLDIAISVNHLENAKCDLLPIMQQADYLFWDTNPDPTKLFFVKGLPPFGQKRSHHVHVMLHTQHDAVVRPLFRNYLKAHPEAKKAYAKLKVELANAFPSDREAYTEAKTAFIRSINLKAIQPYLIFKPLDETDFSLLKQWFSREHIKASYSLKNWSLKEIKAKYGPRLTEDSPIHCFICQIGNVPIGFVQIYPTHKQPQAIGLDFFIGEPSFLGKKIGSLVLNTFCARYLAQHYQSVTVDPSLKNKVAIQFFKANGFRCISKDKSQQLMSKSLIMPPDTQRIESS